MPLLILSLISQRVLSTFQTFHFSQSIYKRRETSNNTKKKISDYARSALLTTPFRRRYNHNNVQPSRYNRKGKTKPTVSRQDCMGMSQNKDGVDNGDNPTLLE